MRGLSYLLGVVMVVSFVLGAATLPNVQTSNLFFAAGLGSLLLGMVVALAPRSNPHLWQYATKPVEKSVSPVEIFRAEWAKQRASKGE